MSARPSAAGNSRSQRWPGCRCPCGRGSPWESSAPRAAGRRPWPASSPATSPPTPAESCSRAPRCRPRGAGRAACCAGGSSWSCRTPGTPCHLASPWRSWCGNRSTWRAPRAPTAMRSLPRRWTAWGFRHRERSLPPAPTSSQEGNCSASWWLGPWWRGPSCWSPTSPPACSMPPSRPASSLS